MILTTGNNSIDSLVHSSWAAQTDTGITVTYNFLTAVPSFASAQDANGFMPMSVAQQQAAQAAMALWASVANIHFVQVASNGNIQLGTNDEGANSVGYAYFPGQSTAVSLYINNTRAEETNFTPGSYAPTLMLTELGYTLGLKNAYANTGDTNAGPFLPSTTDSRDYTVMSNVRPYSYTQNSMDVSTPMLYDIEAMQYLYGANMQFHAGDDHYVFTPATLDQCIWDAGGNDVFDFSACTAANIIDLRAGHFSTTGTGLDAVSIAYNVVIEQAIAGSGGSVIYANDAGDTITGGAGNDYITQGAGNDHITGGGGLDTVVFKGGLSSYQISAVGATVTVHGEGTDTLTGITGLSFQDRFVTTYDLPTLTHALDVQDVVVGNRLDVSLAGAFIQPSSHATPHFGATLANGMALPAWLVFDNLSATFSGTPGSADVGVYTVQLNATGSTGVTVSDDFTLVVGGPAATIKGTDGNDVLVPGAGSHNIDGGAGVDTVVYTDSIADYTANTTNGLLTIINKVGGGGIDTLQNVERIVFADAGFATDVTGEAGQLYRLYGAMYSRAPDADGLGFWLDQMDHGLSLTSVAGYFITSPEYVRTYGNAVSDADFVTSLYHNVLHRDPDADGFTFQLGAMASGVSRAQMLVDFSESPENIAVVTGLIPAVLAYTPVHG